MHPKDRSINWYNVNMHKFIASFLVGLVGGLMLKNLIDSKGIENKATASKKSNKEKNIDQLLALFEEKPRVHNRDVVRLLGVSPKTARNYFNELESSLLIEKKGTTGRDVYYIAKNDLDS